MRLHCTHLLAVLTACSTALAGIPLMAAALAPERGAGACLATAPFDAEDGTDGRVESSGEDREEREQREENGDGELHLFSGNCDAARESTVPRPIVLAPDPVSAGSFFGLAFSIRGPPVR